MVLPVRDAAETLDAAVRSVLASREVCLELVCVDDGSSDETPALLARWERKDPRVRVARMQASGIVPALNQGISLSRGRKLARMDADDEMHPERLAEQSRLLDREAQLALVGCQVESFRAGGLAEGYRRYTDWVNGLLEPEAMLREAFIECPVPHPTWMLRRELLEQLGGYEEHGWPEDLDLLYRLLAKGCRIGKVPRVLHRWRDHDARLSRVDPRYGREAFSRVKAHYLPQVWPMPGAVVWGAGKTGRRLARLLASEGFPTRAFLDINPARIGTEWRGIPILSHLQLPARAGEWRREGLRILVAVASRGARDQIREELVAQGLSEGEDFLMLA